MGLAMALGLASAFGGDALAQNADAGLAVFKANCSACHSAQAGRNLVGPSLFALVGRKAGSVAGFHYSAANKASAMVWDAAELDLYLASPAIVVPHTSMTFSGVKDAQKRADLIAYLTTLR
jgi:cytochrome c